ncbi:hypothetical protein TNCV_1978771 [Trichonephila clavipes]|nr:hypothetical protein TNCV_1978771 [Trichonephila clavipes]
MDGMQMYTVLSQEKTTSPHFQVVYSRDTLPPLQENMCAIVNSDDSSQPGTLWLALFVNDKRELEFYDSFGQPPVFYNISTTTYLDVLWNSEVFQSPTSNSRWDWGQSTWSWASLFIVGILVFDVSGSVVLMGWTKLHCSSFDRVRLTRYIGISKTAGGKGNRCSGGPRVASECERVRESYCQICANRDANESAGRVQISAGPTNEK